MTYRRDKKLFKPATVKTWVIVIYESQGRFRQDTARDMARGFIEGAISVGKCIHYIIFFIAVKLIDSVQVWLSPIPNPWSFGRMVKEILPMYVFFHDIRDADMTLLSFLSNWGKLAKPASTRRELHRPWSLSSSPRAAMTFIRLLRSERYTCLWLVFLLTDVLSSHHLVSETYRWVKSLFFSSIFLDGPQMGVATQCLKSSKCNRAKIQYWANVMLKCVLCFNDIDFILYLWDAGLM